MTAVGVGLMALGVPVTLVSTGVRSVALSEPFYLAEFAKYGVGRTTGLAETQLRDVAGGFIRYFQAPDGPLMLAVATPGGAVPIFSQREIDHMLDVQKIVRAFDDAWLPGLGLLAVGGLCLASDRRLAVARAARGGAIGGGVSVVIVGALALASMLDFQQIFLRFHMVSFSNDLWVLDPARDRLIQLFPLGYFFDAAIRIASHVLAWGGALLVGAIIVERLVRGGQPRL